MSNVIVSGYSDDLIEIDGDIREEFTYQDVDGDDVGDLLAFSDGTVLRIVFANDGCWRITPVVKGTAALSIDLAVEGDEDNYSDKATLDGDVTWAVQGVAYARTSGFVS